MPPPCQAVTATVTRPKANVREVTQMLGDVSWEKAGLGPGVSLHAQLNQRIVLVPAIPCLCKQWPFTQRSREGGLALAMAAALFWGFHGAECPVLGPISLLPFLLSPLLCSP